jgi:exonuclease III
MKPIDIVCFQILRAQTDVVKLQLQSVFPQGHYHIDSLQNGRVGCAIAAAEQVKVLDSGCKGDGSSAWMLIESEVGPIRIAPMYGTADRNRRVDLWRWFEQQKQDKTWLYCGNLNMVELQDDSLSPSPLLHGAEARQWAKITDQLDLIDLYFTAAVRSGQRYTRQAVRGGVLQQARVDRIHVNNRGEWMEYVEVLEHDGGQALSDSSSAS